MNIYSVPEEIGCAFDIYSCFHSVTIMLIPSHGKTYKSFRIVRGGITSNTVIKSDAYDEASIMSDFSHWVLKYNLHLRYFIKK